MQTTYIYHSKDKKFGLPKLKKYPMPDAKHVKSAIKFFNYVDKSNEQELANSILARIKEYGMDISKINIGDENRFKKYLVEKNELYHHGILGQKWGVRRFQKKDGSLTSEGKKRYSDGSEKKKHPILRKVAKGAISFAGGLAIGTVITYLVNRPEVRKIAQDIIRDNSKQKVKDGLAYRDVGEAFLNIIIIPAHMLDRTKELPAANIKTTKP